MGFFSGKKNTRTNRKKKAARAHQKNNGRAKAFLWWLIGLCTALVFIMVFVLSDHGLYELWQLKKEQKIIEQHIEELQAENEKLALERDRLKEDKEYIEKLARERYRMAKKGEKVFRVIPKSNQDSSQ